MLWFPKNNPRSSWKTETYAVALGILIQIWDGGLNMYFFLLKFLQMIFVAWINFGIISYWQHSKTDSLVLQSTKSAQNVCAY